MPKSDLPPKHTSTIALISVIMLSLSWQLTAVVFFGGRIFGPAWPVVFAPHKQWATFAVSVVLSVFQLWWGRSGVREYQRTAGHKEPAVTLGQAALVVVVMIIFGSFGTWIFIGP
ncbi:MAG: hypothetical protein SH850_18565 [Planctomycetaceae bacterium]|nr:hypothetical protein [Planctomycetaceae bacterium]